MIYKNHGYESGMFLYDSYAWYKDYHNFSYFLTLWHSDLIHNGMDYFIGVSSSSLKVPADTNILMEYQSRTNPVIFKIPHCLEIQYIFPFSVAFLFLFFPILMRSRPGSTFSPNNTTSYNYYEELASYCVCFVYNIYIIYI